MRIQNRITVNLDRGHLDGGHSDTQTTEIYLSVVGQEVRQLVAETRGR